METTTDKYFTPDIEDIRIGYEYEIRQAGINKEWIKHTFTPEDSYIGFAARDNRFVGYGMPSIRVPYLTKEQIDAEGWKETTEDTFAHHIYVDIQIYFDDKGKWIWISVPIANSIERAFRYVGECKDINTFRYICKLLKIN